MSGLNALLETHRQLRRAAAFAESLKPANVIVSRFAETQNRLGSKFLETHRNVNRMAALAEPFKQVNDITSKFVETQNKLGAKFLGFDRPSILNVFLEKQNLLDRFSAHISVFDRLKKFNGNPEIAFISISELELLSITSTSELVDVLEEDARDEFITNKEELLEEFLLPHLESLELDYLWIGAGYALNMTDNPDRLRQTLASLRTLLETMIDRELAPKTELAKSEMFKKEFKKYHEGKVELEDVWVKDRAKKIRYFTSKIQFGILEEFTEKDIDFVCNCYSVLCNLHSPDIGLTDNQVRVLKIKTGITLWLLAHINEIIKR